jgi:hypothetical protein
MRVGLTFLIIFLAILSIYLILAWQLTQSSSPDDRQVARRGLRWGSLIASFWFIEIVAGNLADSQQVMVQIFYFGAAMMAFGLPLFAGIWEAKQFGNFRAGLLTGLWSGMISGLLSFLFLMAVAYLFLNTLLLDSQNILQFQNSGAPDIVTFVIGDYLAGAIGHLVIGLVFGAGSGILGGMIGKALTGRIIRPTSYSLTDRQEGTKR